MKGAHIVVGQQVKVVARGPIRVVQIVGPDFVGVVTQHVISGPYIFFLLASFLEGVGPTNCFFLLAGPHAQPSLWVPLYLDTWLVFRRP